MTHRLFSYLTLTALALTFFACQEDSTFAPDATAAAQVSTVEELDATFAAEDAAALQLDDEVYVSTAAIDAALGELTGLQKSGHGRGAARATTVYTQTNTVDNEVVVFTAANDGTLTETGRFRTQGDGSNDNLANQGALFLDQRNDLLYAVNAGSDELTVFSVNGDGTLGFLNKVRTQGTRPVSVTAYENIVYVVNAGTDNVEGFRLNRRGRLVSLPNSVRALSSTGTAPAQISFKPNGRALLVTEKATNALTSFAVRPNGRLSRTANVLTAANDTPFGFDFLRGRTLVSEAAGGAAGAGTVSTYRLRNDGTVRLLSGPLQLDQAATCWVSANRRTGYVFATNTADDSVSSLTLGGNDLSLINGGQTTLADFTPHDAGQNRAGTYLYVVTIGSDEVISYRIGTGGSLTQIDTDGNLGDFSSGIQVRR